MAEHLRIRKVNPFAVTAAVDLTDEEIQRLWVAVSPGDTQAVFRPKSPMPLFLLGGKGSGKTHWMRYHSFSLQRLRYEERGVSLLSGLSQEGYLGIYILLGNLNAERFRERNKSEEVWRTIFAYYLELWLAQELLHILSALCLEDAAIRRAEKDVCLAILGLMDSPPPEPVDTFSKCLDWLSQLQAQIDRAINNAIFADRLNIHVRVTPGQLIFGIPKILKRKISALRHLIFSYQLDEFEMLSEDQQKHINTLIRDRSLPSTFRIGGRLWSIKTRSTYADGEENREGSEFETWFLDQRFRQSKAQWISFSYRLVQRRMEVAGLGFGQKIVRSQIDSVFETPKLTWDSEFVRERAGSKHGMLSIHLAKLERKLKAGARAGVSFGVRSDEDIRTVISRLSVSNYPLLEKVNVLLLYQAWFRGDDLLRRSSAIENECRVFIRHAQRPGKYQRAVQHYGSDLLAQLFRDERKKQSLQYGMKSFIRMSEGLPRSLLTLLKEIFDWAIYNSAADHIDAISSRDQDLGLMDSADWFLTTMRKSGKNESAIITAIERIGRLFETNRFADKPIECSLLGFSIRERDLQPLTQERLRLAEQHSFLIRITRGGIDKNTRERVSKFQLNALLGPRWNLPAARRGIVPLKPREIDVIFDPSREGEFDAFHKSWEQRMSAPFFGKRHALDRTPSLFADLP